MITAEAVSTRELKNDYILSLIAALLLAIASLAGLLFQSSIYPTEELNNSFLANEVVNLLIGLPALLYSLWAARQGELVGLLLWPGALLYILYNYIAYLLGVPFSWISLVYLALVLVSGYVFVDLLRGIDKNAVQGRLTGAVPVKVSGWVLVILGSLFILRALGMLIQAGLNHGSLPMAEIGVLTADILLSSIWIAGGVFLLRKKPLGYASGLGLLFAGSLLFVALILFLLLGPLLTGTAFSFTDVFVVLIMGMFCFVPFFLFLRGVLSERNQRP